MVVGAAVPPRCVEVTVDGPLEESGSQSNVEQAEQESRQNTTICRLNLRSVSVSDQKTLVFWKHQPKKCKTAISQGKSRFPSSRFMSLVVITSVDFFQITEKFNGKERNNLFFLEKGFNETSFCLNAKNKAADKLFCFYKVIWFQENMHFLIITSIPLSQ